MVSKPAPMRLMMPSRGSCGEDAFGDRRVLEQEGVEFPAGRNHLVFAGALGGDELDTGVAEDLALEREVAIVMVGVENAGHLNPAVTERGAHAPRRKRVRRSVVLVKWPYRLRVASLPYNALRHPPLRPSVLFLESPPMLLPTTIAGSLPKPAWLAPAEPALGAVAARGLAAGGRQARRRAPGGRRSGTRRHRHRHRRRADAPPFRHDVHRKPRRRRFRAQEDGADPQSLRRRRAGRHRPDRASASGICRRRRVPARPHPAPGQVHAAGADDRWSTPCTTRITAAAKSSPGRLPRS